MNSLTLQIKAAFLTNFYVIGDNKEQILDELDMAIYQHTQLRDSEEHEKILTWGSNFLDAAGVR